MTLWQRLTLLWALLATALAVLTGVRVSTGGWWSLVTAWFKWPFPGLLGLIAMIVGIAVAAAAWSWRDRVEGVWRWTALFAAFVSVVVSLVLLVCAVLALMRWVISLLAGDDKDDGYRIRASRRRGRRRRRHRTRRRSSYSRW